MSESVLFRVHVTMEKNASFFVEQREVFLLFLDFLRENECFVSLRSLEKEIGLNLDKEGLNKEFCSEMETAGLNLLSCFRDALLDGQFSECERLLLLLKQVFCASFFI
jgi:hypothetical protein